MFEITQLAAADTFTLELLQPNGNPLVGADGAPLSVTIYGPGSKAYQKAKAARSARLGVLLKPKHKMTLTDAENYQENAEFMAECTVSFNGWGYKGANDQAAMVAAYSDHSIDFITEQISRAIVNWENFTSSSSKS
jgi:hypothetical protein